MEDSKYIIICANCSHPSGELKYFLATDEDENTLEFENRKAATEWVLAAENVGMPFAYSLIAVDELSYAL